MWKENPYDQDYQVNQPSRIWKLGFLLLIFIIFFSLILFFLKVSSYEPTVYYLDVSKKRLAECNEEHYPVDVNYDAWRICVTTE